MRTWESRLWKNHASKGKNVCTNTLNSAFRELCLLLLNRVHIGIGKYTVIQLVVSRLFAGDNRLSPDILLVTTGCHQTFC